MSAPEKPAGGPPVKESYVDLAERIFINFSARVYSAAGDKKPDPKVLAAFCFKLADAFEAASRETPREMAKIEAANKAAVKLDQVDISTLFAATTPPKAAAAPAAAPAAPKPG
jgi:hypothetical protein